MFHCAAGLEDAPGEAEDHERYLQLTSLLMGNFSAARGTWDENVSRGPERGRRLEKRLSSLS